VEIATALQLVTTIAITTVCWVTTAYAGPQNDERVLMDFYRKVRPFGPGWNRIRAKVGPSVEPDAENFPLAIVGWLTGCIMIWSALFAVGNFLYGRMEYAYGLLAVFVVSAAILIRIIKRIWR